MEQILPWLISLVSGGVGGNIGGALVKGLGGGLRTIIGALGGVLGGQYLGPMLDFVKNLGETGGNAASAAGVGGLLTMLIGLFAKKKKPE